MSSLSTLSVDVQKPDVDRALHSQHVDSRHLAKDLAAGAGPRQMMTGQETEP